jgi:hypothetical protein
LYHQPQRYLEGLKNYYSELMQNNFNALRLYQPSRAPTYLHEEII